MFFPSGYFPPGYFPPGYFEPGTASLPALLSLSLLSLFVTVGYEPNPLTAALMITEAGQAFGPYPASVAASGDDIYTLTSDLTAVPMGVVPGSVLVQPGDIISGAFVPAPNVPATAGTLAFAASALIDWAASATGPFAGIGQPAVLPATAAKWVHVGISVTDSLSGAPVLLTGNPAVLGLAAAIVRSDPAVSDWQPAQVVTRAAGDALDGEYLQIKVGPGSALVLTPGEWDVYFQITTAAEVIQDKAPNTLGVT